MCIRDSAQAELLDRAYARTQPTARRRLTMSDALIRYVTAVRMRHRHSDDAVEPVARIRPLDEL